MTGVGEGHVPGWPAAPANMGALAAGTDAAIGDWLPAERTEGAGPTMLAGPTSGGAAMRGGGPVRP
ncbi:MAG TPA: hypothetical protein VFO16_15035 [Pseudonocardiaceae bacterium]|nr:hypothetical protein [Pseudonocardiaceae bacterium]